MFISAAAFLRSLSTFARSASFFSCVSEEVWHLLGAIVLRDVALIFLEGRCVSGLYIHHLKYGEAVAGGGCGRGSALACIECLIEQGGGICQRRRSCLSRAT